MKKQNIDQHLQKLEAEWEAFRDTRTHDIWECSAIEPADEARDSGISANVTLLPDGTIEITALTSRLDCHDEACLVLKPRHPDRKRG